MFFLNCFPLKYSTCYAPRLLFPEFILVLKTFQQNLPGLDMSVDEVLLTQASRGGTLKFNPNTNELVRAESGVLDDAQKDVNQFQNRRLNKDGTAVGADIEGTYLTQKLNENGQLHSYSAPELRAEYEPVVDAMGNRLEGL